MPPTDSLTPIQDDSYEPAAAGAAMLMARRIPDGRVLWVSDDFTAFTGRDPAPFLDGTAEIMDLVHHADRWRFTSTAEGIAPLVLVWRMVLPGGGLRWVRSRVASTIELPGGRCWMAVVEDIHDDVLERQHAAAVEEAFAELTLLLNDAGPDGVAPAIDQGLRLLGELVGADRAYVFRTHGDGLVSNTHEWCAPGVEPVIEMLQDLPVKDFGWLLGQLWDGPRLIDVDAMPPEAASEREVLRAQGINSLVLAPTRWRGELVGFVGFDSVVPARAWRPVDVTVLSRFSRAAQSALVRVAAERETRETLAELDAARVAAETAVAAKTRLLSRVSHELRTPAAIVVNAAEVLGLCDLDPDGRAALERIEAAGRDQVAMVDDLLQVASARAGAGRRSGDVDVVALVREECDTTRTVSPVRLSVVAPLPVVVHTDAFTLRQVVSNLVSNAAKYGGGSAEVRVTPHDDGVRIVVSDDGPGIGSSDLHRIWEPFDRLGAESGDVPGTGLGLSIVAQAVAELGGSVEVSSSGAGTSFTVTVPTDGVHRPGGGDVPLLVVDDNAVFADTLELGLRRLGGFTDVRVVGTRAEAVAVVGERAPAAVILDRNLPDGHGEGIIGQLRQVAGPGLVVVVLSADSSPAAKERCLAAGADAYFTKPARAAELCRTIHELLGSRRAS